MMGIDGKTIFNEDAELYDRMRPSYPEQLIEDVIAYSQIPSDARIIEIGCGPGKATCQFAAKGYRMLCIEPGADLAAITREKCRGLEVEVAITSFEDWQVQESAFDLAYAASAFHWLDREVRVPKMARALKGGGTLALFWNKHSGPHSELMIETCRLHVKHGYEHAWNEAEMRSRTGLTEEDIRPWADEIDASELFGPVTVQTYPWSQDYTAEEYVALLDTFSGHRAMPEDMKRRLYRDIADLVNRHGGTITKQHTSLLYLARRRS